MSGIGMRMSMLDVGAGIDRLGGVGVGACVVEQPVTIPAAIKTIGAAIKTTEVDRLTPTIQSYQRMMEIAQR